MIQTGRPAVPAAIRFLPAVPEGFELSDSERLSDGLRRLSLEEFDRAIGGLLHGSDVDVAVHEARKSMKRLRAVLRMIRDELGEERYRRENELLRNTARLIGPVRDSAVLMKTVATTRARFAVHLRRSAFETLENNLARRHEEARARLVEDPVVLHRVVYALRSARARYRVWPAEADPEETWRARPVAHSFDAMRGGLLRTYRRGRREMRVAEREPTAHNFHWWRKRVKYLRHQMELLRPMFPEVLDGYIAALDHLGELLGEEHDLAELVALVAERPEMCADAAEVTLITALAEHRRSELHTAALAIGHKVYAESPKAFANRLGAYWSTSFALAGATQGS
jgi:CHAD domain-containing protein